MLRMTPLASAIVALLLGIEAYAAEETFDTHFMIGGMKDQQVANIRLDDNQPLPGQYDIDIYVNKQWRGKYEIIVKDNPQETCLSREVIKRLGINSDNFASGKQCLTFEQLVQGGSYTWDIGVFRLDFSVPQAWVEELESGYVPPENWERGINAFYTSYYLSQYYSDYKASGNNKSTYVRFNRERARRNLFLINHKTILFNSYQRVTLSNPLHPWRKILFRVRQHLHITKQPHTSEANRIKNIA